MSGRVTYSYTYDIFEMPGARNSASTMFSYRSNLPPPQIGCFLDLSDFGDAYDHEYKVVRLSYIMQKAEIIDTLDICNHIIVQVFVTKIEATF